MSLTDEQVAWYVNHTPWFPQEGPQTAAYDSAADLLLYGGAAGGGKTALAVGLAVCEHRETLFVRREATQLGAVIDYVSEVVETRDGLNGQDKIFRLPQWDGIARKIVFGSTPHAGDETKYQGRPRDLLVVDEAANMLESQVHFLKGWVRSTVPGQRCRTLLCSNPPTGAEGAWLVDWFAPWLDPQHELYPCPPGELLWYATIGGKEARVENGDPIPNPAPIDENDMWIIPQSRTFIPAKVTDNAYLRDSGYMATLQALPEPLRSQMLYGDFTAGRDDDEYQVIPADWVRQAQARWQERPFDNITSCGIDPSRGGRDQTVFSARSGWHFHPLSRWEGEDMKTGGSVAGKVIDLVGHHRCPVHVDVIGIGASVVDHLDAVIHARTVPVNFAGKSGDKDWSGTMTFTNKRAECWWRLRDLLNPANSQKVELPPDQKLMADLTAPRYKLTSTGIQIESKADIVKRLGRSPDSGDAVVMCAESAALIEIEGFQRPRHQINRAM